MGKKYFNEKNANCNQYLQFIYFYDLQKGIESLPQTLLF